VSRGHAVAAGTVVWIGALAAPHLTESLDEPKQTEVYPAAEA